MNIEYDSTFVSQHFFEIKIDGVLNAKVENENPRQYRDVTVGTAFASNLRPANAVIRNFVFQQCTGTGKIYYQHICNLHRILFMKEIAFPMSRKVMRV